MWDILVVGGTALAIVTLVVVLKTCIVVTEREVAIKERLGKFQAVLRPGFHILVPFLERVAYRHDVRERVVDVPMQSCITRDNIQVGVDGVLYLKVTDPERASYGINNYLDAASNLAQTTMRSEIGKMDLDSCFSERDEINDKIMREIDRASDPWGIKVMRYEIENINPTRQIVDTLVKQMEAERRKRADITLASAERESTINVSKGERQEKINLSEGMKQQRINEAEGRAREIEILAEASAAAIRRVGEALCRPSGQDALHLRLTEQFVDEMGKVLGEAQVTVLPLEVASLRAVMEGVSKAAAAHAPGSPAAAAARVGIPVLPTARNA